MARSLDETSGRAIEPQWRCAAAERPDYEACCRDRRRLAEANQPYREIKAGLSLGAYGVWETWEVGLICWGVVPGLSESLPKTVFQRAMATITAATMAHVDGFLARRETTVGLTYVAAR